MFKDRLKIIRKQKKLTQSELADLINTTKGTVSNYENGVSSPSLEDFVVICKALNVSPDELLGYKNINTEHFTPVINPNIASFINSNKNLLVTLSNLNDEKLKALERLLK